MSIFVLNFLILFIINLINIWQEQKEQQILTATIKSIKRDYIFC